MIACAIAVVRGKYDDPNEPGEYQDALTTLYPVAYGLKVLSKRELDRDYVVPPLEAVCDISRTPRAALVHLVQDAARAISRELATSG